MTTSELRPIILSELVIDTACQPFAVHMPNTGRAQLQIVGPAQHGAATPLACISARPGDEDNDLIRGGNGGDILSGGTGNDQLLGVLGADTLNGGEGDDDLCGGDGTDALFGDDGDDDLRGGNGTDTCDGGTGAEIAGDQHIGGCETITNVP